MGIQQALLSYSASASPPQSIVWANLLLASVIAGNKLQSDSVTNWLDGGSSAQALPANIAGYVEAIVDVTTSTRMFGLGTTNTGGNINRINFTMDLAGSLAAFELGVLAFLGPGYVVGDTVRVNRDASGVVTYLKNGVIFYTSAVNNTGILYANGTVKLNTKNMENLTLSGTFQ